MSKLEPVGEVEACAPPRFVVHRTPRPEKFSTEQRVTFGQSSY